MPSPIAHCALFMLAWPMARKALPIIRSRRATLMFAAAVLVSLMAPDLDLLPGFITGQGFAKYHNGPTHSLVFALAIGVLFAVVGRPLCGISAKALFLIGSCGCAAHVILDMFTFGRGVLLLWPFSDERISSPVTLFLGVRHSVNAPWVVHAFAILGEAAFALMIWFIAATIYKPTSVRRDESDSP